MFDLMQMMDNVALLCEIDQNQLSNIFTSIIIALKVSLIKYKIIIIYQQSLTDNCILLLMQPFDWFVLATPIFIILTLLILIALKMSLKSEPNISQTLMRKLRTQETQRTQTQQKSAIQKYSSLKVLNFLMRNHSFVQICATRKSKNKHPMLLSVSVISVLCIVNPSIFINSIVGIPIVLAFITAQICLQPNEHNLTIMDVQRQQINVSKPQVKNSETITSKRHKYLYIVCSFLASAISLLMCGLTYKNYSNLFLSNLLKNVFINVLIDIFALKPLGFTLLSLPLSFNTKLMVHIQNQKLKQNYKFMVEQQFNEVINCATKLSPRKQTNSPTKVPKAVFHINKQNIDNEALKNAIDLSKKIKKQKIGQNDFMKPAHLRNLNEVENERYYLQQNSLNQLFEQGDSSKKHGRQTPVAMFNDEEDYENGGKTKRKSTDLVIVQFKKNEQQNQKDVVNRRATSFLHSNLDFDEENINKKQNSTLEHQKRKNLLKLFGNNNSNYEEDQQNDSKRHEDEYTITHERNDPLRVYNLDEGRQFEQIDVNSPTKHRGKKQQSDSSQYKLKKKDKHFKGNARRRTIKFTSGEPYLEYLPNMLNKDKHKKSQPITVMKQELDFLQDKKKGLLRKTKTKRQRKFQFVGDQNYFPGTMQVQDI